MKNTREFEVNVITRNGQPTQTFIVDSETEAQELAEKFVANKVWSCNFVSVSANASTARPAWVVRNGEII